MHTSMIPSRPLIAIGRTTRCGIGGLLAILCLSLVAPLGAVEGPSLDDDQAVLFVGDESLAAGGGVDVHFRGFADRAGRDIGAGRRTAAGWTLGHHRRDGTTRNRLGDYQVVVLLDRGSRPLTDRGPALDDVRALAGEIRAVGGRPAIGIGWTTVDEDGALIQLAEAAAQTAVEVAVPSLPFGLAVGRARSRRGDLPLLDSPTTPTTAGAYLAAAVAYAQMVGDVRGIDYVPGGLSASDARFLRTMAQESVSLHDTGRPRNETVETGVDGSPLGFLAYEPVGYDVLDRSEFPLVVYLGGVGERGPGTDSALREKVEAHGPFKLTSGRDGNYRRGRHLPAVVVGPNHEAAWNADTLRAFITHVRERYRIDHERIYLTGLNEGGGGVMACVDAFGDDIAAVLPITSNRVPTDAAAAGGVAMWLHHNFHDETVGWQRSLDAADVAARGRLGPDVSAIRGSYPHAAGDIRRPAESIRTASLSQGAWVWHEGRSLSVADPSAERNQLLCTIDPRSGHDAWSYTYARQVVWDWLFAQRRVASAPTVEPTVIVDGSVLEAEDFDLGGEGVAYHDTDASNIGGQYRNEGVDIERCSDLGGGYNIGWIAAGEWQRYTVEVATAGTYSVSVRVASPSQRTLTLEVDGTRYPVTVPATGSYATWGDAVITGVELPAGVTTLVLRHGGGYNVNAMTFALETPAPVEEPPTTVEPTVIVDGSVLEAEDFDLGGEGVAYHDTDASNIGGQYRNEGVDIERCSDLGGGYNIGWIAAGEWQRYTVEVAAAGTYSVSVRVAAPSQRTLTLEVDGTRYPVTVPATGSYATWGDTVVSGVELPAGVTTLVLRHGGGYNVNAMTFALDAPAPVEEPPPTVEPTVIVDGSVLEAEDFDLGGEGVAYHDTDASNIGGQYRNEGVDIERCSDLGGGYNIGWIAAGEWQRYTVEVAAAGTYSVSVRVASPSQRTLTLEVDGTRYPVTVPATGSYATWGDAVVSGVELPAGVTTLVLRHGGGYNVNAMTFALETPAPVEEPPTTVEPTVIVDGSVLEAEDFDLGGEGVAYHDTDASNIGGQYRNEGVDIERCSDLGGGYNIGWIAADEWQRYTVEVAAAGTYSVSVRVASPSQRTLTLEVDGTRYPATVPATGSYATWGDAVITGVELPAGVTTLVLRHGGGYNVNAMTFALETPAPVEEPGDGDDGGSGGDGRSFYGQPFELRDGLRIEAEDYDLGGEGVGYHDTDPTNQGGYYRADGVDIEPCSDGGYNVGWIKAGEWLTYRIDVKEAGRYAIDLRYARHTSTAVRVRISVGDRQIESEVGGTGGFQSWQGQEVGVVDLPVGVTDLRVTFPDGGLNFDRLELWRANDDDRQEEITIDNRDERFVVLEGDWRASVHSPGYFDTDYLVAYPKGVQDASVCFAPELIGGYYEVHVHHPNDGWRDRRVPVAIDHVGGRSTFDLDLTSGGGRWHQLGVFRFDSGRQPCVTILTAGTSGWVVADAVRFVRVTNAGQ